MQEILTKLYEMTALSGITLKTVLMWLIAFLLLYLGIKKKYEPLLLVPIGFGVLVANFPGAEMGVVAAENIELADHRYKNLFEIAHEFGILNFLY
ncbi:MAG: sodium ion-translocating decarboxylase subunit beta, partial [Bacteroidales bacterium]|nr:sodium ion-translocating decarboxylase subunit beta [Bacteroidales bacterium]